MVGTTQMFKIFSGKRWDNATKTYPVWPRTRVWERTLTVGESCSHCRIDWLNILMISTLLKGKNSCDWTIWSDADWTTSSDANFFLLKKNKQINKETWSLVQWDLLFNESSVRYTQNPEGFYHFRRWSVSWQVLGAQTNGTIHAKHLNIRSC